MTAWPTLEVSTPLGPVVLCATDEEARERGRREVVLGPLMVDRLAAVDRIFPGSRVKRIVRSVPRIGKGATR